MHPPKFVGNVGIDKEIFQSNHNFFRLINDDKEALRNRESFKLFSKSDTYKLPSGNKIKINPFRDEQDYKDNLQRGVMMVDKLSIDVELRPDVKNWKNPEYRLNGLIADLYKGDIINGFKEKRLQIKGFIRKFNSNYPKQAVSEEYAIVFDITNVKIGYDIARVVNGKFRTGSKMNFIVIVNDNKIIKIDKEDSFDTIVSKVELLNAKEKQ